MRARRRITTLLLGAALAASFLLTGCGADARQTDSAAKGDSGVGTRAEPPAGAAAVQGGGTAPEQKADSPDLSLDKRSIIYRGSLSVRVQNVNAAAGDTGGIATTAGGFVGSDQRSTGGNGNDTATIELRVPAPKFGAVVEQLGKLGVEQQRQFDTEDVTEQVVDLDARITVQQARVDSGRKLLAQAKTLNDLVLLEKEVATRESDLASLQAKKTKLADLTALSTITVTLFQQHPPAAAPKSDKPGFLSGLKAGWDALLASLRVALTVLGALLPWLIILGLPAWGLYRLYRRYLAPRRATHTGRVAVAGGPGALPGRRMGEQATPPADTPPADTSPADTSPADASPGRSRGASPGPVSPAGEAAPETGTDRSDDKSDDD
jgi:hypothetical protein